MSNLKIISAACNPTALRASLPTPQQATPEPVLTVEREPDYWSGGHFYEGSKPHIDPTKVWSLPIGTKLYTRPAPGVPEDVQRDAERLDWLTFNISGKALRDIGVMWGEHTNARAAIDAAMLAAKERS